METFIWHKPNTRHPSLVQETAVFIMYIGNWEKTYTCLLNLLLYTRIGTDASAWQAMFDE